MAGIGFELRKLLSSESYFGLLRAYGYAGLISSGPWVFSIVGLLAVGMVSAGRPGAALQVDPFLVSVTYLMASSLVLAGPLQLLFSRFVADRLYENDTRSILPNLLGALALTSAASGAIGTVILTVFFREPLLFRALLLASFVVLCDLWLVVVLLSGLKQYRAVLGSYFAGYSLLVGLSLLLRPFGISGLLCGFLFGQTFILLFSFALIVRRFPSRELFRFDFLRRDRAHYDLALVGLLYNLAIWIDKIVFWYVPHTSKAVIGPLRASIIYDLPMFLAYLSIVPGMAVFLVRVETDFAEKNEAFFHAILHGATLAEIEKRKILIVKSVRTALAEIFKVQGLTVLFLILLGPRILAALGLSPLHRGLYNLDLAAVFMQLLLLAVISVLFYLDQRRSALALTVMLFVTNLFFTLASQHYGPRWYGYGLALSVLATSLVGLAVLSRKLERLEYETFMLQPG